MTQDNTGSGAGTTTGAPTGGVATGAAPDLVGSVLAGRYRILEKLGEGAMGAVYLGEHVRMGRRDAIKVLLGPLSKDPEAVARFNRGARNVAQVHHPNVCTVYDFSDTAEGLTFMAMELIVGESLKDLLLREHALPAERAVAIAKQTADALQAAHDAGIVHRDLKPGNIMLTRGRDGSDVVKVVDFDIAKGQAEVEGAELTRVGFVVGTPEYMSPEQLIGDKLDGRSDLYSLGLCLFRMLTGALPFRADSPQDVMIQRLTIQPLSLEDAAPGKAFPGGLQGALDRALARKAADRQASAGEFGREIVAALAAPAGGAAPPPQRRESTVPPTVIAPAPPSLAPPVAVGAPAAAAPAAAVAPPGARRRVPAAAIGGGAALLIVLAGGIAWFARARPPAPTPTSAAPAATPPAGGSAAVGGGSAAVGGGSAATPPAVAPTAAQPGTIPPVGKADRRPTGTTPSGNAGPGAASAGSATPPPRPTLSAGDASTILWRQFDRIGPPYPAARQVLAIRDTAGAFLDMEGVGDKERALAAFIMAHSYIATGDDNRVLPLLQRAVALDPGAGGYRTLLTEYRRRQER